MPIAATVIVEILVMTNIVSIIMTSLERMNVLRYNGHDPLTREKEEEESTLIDIRRGPSLLFFKDLILVEVIRIEIQN